MTLAQLLPQGQVRGRYDALQPAAQKVAARAADTAQRLDLDVIGVIENMAGFTTPEGDRFTIFGEGGGQLLADELDVPLLGKIPLQEALRVGATRPPGGAGRPGRPGLAGDLRRGTGHPRRHPAGARRFQAASGPPVPEVTGTALPMAK